MKAARNSASMLCHPSRHEEDDVDGMMRASPARRLVATAGSTADVDELQALVLARK